MSATIKLDCSFLDSVMSPLPYVPVSELLIFKKVLIICVTRGSDAALLFMRI